MQKKDKKCTIQSLTIWILEATRNLHFTTLVRFKPQKRVMQELLGKLYFQEAEGQNNLFVLITKSQDPDVQEYASSTRDQIRSV